MKFYKCAHCGKIVALVNEEKMGIPTICCGEPMSLMIPNSQDGAVEKHVPVVKVEGRVATVTVGEVLHPMMENHFIQWIFLKTNKGNRRVELKPGDVPEAKFALADDEVVLEAVEYCNLHGLYSAKVK